MSGLENPWQSPQNVSAPETPLMAQTALTETMLRYLKESSPWLRFVGILGFIACGLMFFGGIIAAIAMLAVSAFADELDGFPAGIFGLLYIVLGVVMFFPARFTYSFGAKIRNYQLSNSEQDLELAFKNNKALWKFYGIFCIVNLALIPVGIIGGIVAIAAGLASL
jgi:uncharacterized membrane protein SirB2